MVKGLVSCVSKFFLEMVEMPDKRLGFWDSRSSLGLAAGSGDINLKRLEINAICDNIGNPTTVLDAGCGNGVTLLELASRFESSSLYGFDYSQGMINAGLELTRSKNLHERIKLCRASLLDQFPSALSSLDIPSRGFDAIYTERSIINLDNFEQQCEAIHSLWNMVSAGGRLILCESFHDGLNDINKYRTAVGLNKIDPPWHNRYLSLSELDSLFADLSVEYVVNEFSGSYYFVSRVVHAYQAHLQGVEPAYDAEINQQSLALPPLSCFGQSKIIVCKKK